MYGYWRRARVNLFAPNCGSLPPLRYTMYLLPEPTGLYLYNNMYLYRYIILLSRNALVDVCRFVALWSIKY